MYPLSCLAVAISMFRTRALQSLEYAAVCHELEIASAVF